MLNFMYSHFPFKYNAYLYNRNMTKVMLSLFQQACLNMYYYANCRIKERTTEVIRRCSSLLYKTSIYSAVKNSEDW